jgi:hypothetical protein
MEKSPFLRFWDSLARFVGLRPRVAGGVALHGGALPPGRVAVFMPGTDGRVELGAIVDVGTSKIRHPLYAAINILAGARRSRGVLYRSGRMPAMPATGDVFVYGGRRGGVRIIRTLSGGRFVKAA